MKKIRLLCKWTLMPLVLVCLGILSVQAEQNRVKFIKGIVVTGPNRILDKPARDYGTVLNVPVGTINFSELAVYNPDAEEPLPLTSDTDESAVLASFVDPGAVALFGYDPSMVDKSLNNVPLQKVKTLVSGDNVTREELPDIFESEPLSQSIAAPGNPITLGDWMKARGYAVIRCGFNNTGHVRLMMRNLIPNRLYTVWGAVVNSDGRISNPPLGGAPSAFVTNDRGRANFIRELNFCPLDVVDEVNAQLMFIAVILHSDHMAYGAVFGLDELGFFGGSHSHDHMAFPLLGTEIK